MPPSARTFSIRYDPIRSRTVVFLAMTEKTPPSGICFSPEPRGDARRTSQQRRDDPACGVRVAQRARRGHAGHDCAAIAVDARSDRKAGPAVAENVQAAALRVDGRDPHVGPVAPGALADDVLRAHEDARAERR